MMLYKLALTLIITLFDHHIRSLHSEHHQLSVLNKIQSQTKLMNKIQDTTLKRITKERNAALFKTNQNGAK